MFTVRAAVKRGVVTSGDEYFGISEAGPRMARRWRSCVTGIAMSSSMSSHSRVSTAIGESNESSKAGSACARVYTPVTIIRFPKRLPLSDWQGFYTTAQVSRLAGVPIATLYEWKRRGIITPSLQMLEGGDVVDQGYSYADLSFVRIIRALRERKLNFDGAARSLRHLYERLGPPNEGWAKEKVYVVGDRVYAERPDQWGTTDATEMGQTLIPVFFGDIFDELRGLEEGASILVPPRFRKYVEINPLVMGGEPVVLGSRLPTAVLRTMQQKYRSLEKLAALYRPIDKVKLENALEYEKYLDERAA